MEKQRDKRDESDQRTIMSKRRIFFYVHAGTQDGLLEQFE
jgi:hypothetical protein